MSPTIEEIRSRERALDTWSSPLYPAVFFIGFALEWGLWVDAPFMRLGWIAVLALSLVVASTPWIGSVRHREASAAARRHPARFALLLPALLLHLGAFTLYGPDRRAGSGDSTVTVNQVLMALLDGERMPALLVPAAERTEYEVRFLLRLGADPNAADADGRYPLDVARDPGVLTLLLDRGGRAHSASVAVILLTMARAGEAGILRRLLAVGVHPDLTLSEMEGYGAAHEAAYMDHAEALRVLLEGGADPGRRTARGETVADYARRGQAESVLAVLAEFEAESPRGRRAPVPQTALRPGVEGTSAGARP